MAKENRLTLTYPDIIRIKNKYGGTCPDCKNEFKFGEKAILLSDMGQRGKTKVVHAACWDKKYL